jgi:hypothetical protein
VSATRLAAAKGIDTIARSRDPHPVSEGAQPLDPVDLTALVNVLSEDIRHVHVRITAAIGIAAVFVTQIPLNDLRGLPWWAEWLTFAGVVLLMISALSYFQYTQEINKFRLKLVAEGLNWGEGKTSAVASWNKRFEPRPGWRRGNVWYFWGGQAFLMAGIAAFAVVLLQLIPLSD